MRKIFILVLLTSLGACMASQNTCREIKPPLEGGIGGTGHAPSDPCQGEAINAFSGKVGD